jgi:MFS transporter, DHA1 family, multidrug resistance protein
MIKPNRLIVKIIATDFFIHAGWGLIAPIFAIFVTGQINGGSLELVGIAVGIHWIVKSVIQPFLAYHMDVVKGEHDDMKFLLGGTIIATLVSLLYIFVSEIWHVILLEAIRGAGLAMVIPTLSGILTRHVDKDWETYTWSLQSTGMGLAAGFSAIFGGVIAGLLGFKAVFLLVAVINSVSMAITYFAIKKDPWLNRIEKTLR